MNNMIIISKAFGNSILNFLSIKKGITNKVKDNKQRKALFKSPRKNSNTIHIVTNARKTKYTATELFPFSFPSLFNSFSNLFHFFSHFLSLPFINYAFKVRYFFFLFSLFPVLGLLNKVKIF